MGPEQVLVMEQKYYSFEEGGHRGGPSLRNRVWVIQPVLHRSEEGWRVMTYFRSVSFEPLSQDATEVMSQMKSEDWFVTIDLKGAHVFTLTHHRKFLRFAFGGKSLPTQSSFSLFLHSHPTLSQCVDTVLAPP